MESDIEKIATERIVKIILESADLRGKITDVLEQEQATAPHGMFSMILLAATSAVFTDLPRNSFLKVCDTLYSMAVYLSARHKNRN